MANISDSGEDSLSGETEELSPIDRRILRVLQRDGRTSNADLAKQVSLRI